VEGSGEVTRYCDSGIPKYFCNFSSPGLGDEGLMAPARSIVPFVCGMCGLPLVVLASMLERPLTRGRAVMPPEPELGGSRTLVRLRKENRFPPFSSLDGRGECGACVGLGDLAATNGCVVIAAPASASPESHVAEVSGRSPGAGALKAAISGEKVISKPTPR
jgi:hypothetical protein